MDFETSHAWLLDELCRHQLPAHPLDHVLATVDFGSKPALEFGVFSGVSIGRIRHAVKGDVYGFDSFEGLPEQWRQGYPRGSFDMAGLPAVGPDVTLVKGWFDKTLPQFVQDTLGDRQIGLLHVDCDLYSSTKTVFDCLQRNIGPGTVIVFDEMINYPGYEQHELLAFWEYVRDTGVKFEIIGGYGNPFAFRDTCVEHYNNQQVAVRIV